MVDSRTEKGSYKRNDYTMALQPTKKINKQKTDKKELWTEFYSQNPKRRRKKN